MAILLALIPISLVLLGFAIGAFVWAVRRGQFDDLQTPALDILGDDLAPTARRRAGAAVTSRSDGTGSDDDAV
jgi:cbb3-type cytochrome oxidase maturation protein